MAGNQVKTTTHFCEDYIIGKTNEKEYPSQRLISNDQENNVSFIINDLEPCRVYTAVISVINSLDEIATEDNVTFSELYLYSMQVYKIFYQLRIIYKMS